MPKLNKDKVGRYVLLHKDLDKWLQVQAKQRGLSSLQQYLVMIATDARRAEQKTAEAQHA